MPHTSQRILISDFDGTMTRHDFYKLVIRSLLPEGTPNYWAEYRSGQITHFEALRRYFAAIRVSEDEVLEVVRQMELDPQLPGAIASLRQAGWRIVVTSAGCTWYIHWLLLSTGIDLEVYANPGRFEQGNGLVMTLPADSPFYSPTLGINKAGVVRDFLDRGATVAFAGDGFPDAEAAQLVSADLRFARADLADVLLGQSQSFHPFESWSDIATNLLRRDL